VTATGVLTQPASETIHVELQQQIGEQVQALAAGDLMLTTTAPTTSATAQVALHLGAAPTECGDAVTLQVTHPTGAQTLYFFSLTLDVP